MNIPGTKKALETEANIVNEMQWRFLRAVLTEYEEAQQALSEILEGTSAETAQWCQEAAGDPWIPPRTHSADAAGTWVHLRLGQDSSLTGETNWEAIALTRRIEEWCNTYNLPRAYWMHLKVLHIVMLHALYFKPDKEWPRLQVPNGPIIYFVPEEGECHEGDGIPIYVTRGPLGYIEIALTTSGYLIDFSKDPDRPRPPVLPECNYWEIENYEQDASRLVKNYLSDLRRYLEENAPILKEPQRKRELDKHMQWLVWKVVDGMSLREIAERLDPAGDHDLKHRTVHDALTKLAPLVGVQS